MFIEDGSLIWGEALFFFATYLSSDWYVSQAFIPNVISTVHDDTYSLQALHSVSFPKNNEVLISDCSSPPAPTWGVEPKVTTPDKSFPSCSSRLTSRIWIRTETKYTEFFLSISSDGETWNLGRKGESSQFDCVRTLSTERVFLTFLCWLSVGCTGNGEDCSTYKELSVQDGFEEVAVTGLCWLSIPTPPLFFSLVVGIWMHVKLSQCLVNSLCFLRLIQDGVCLLGASHHCVYSSPVFVCCPCGSERGSTGSP